MPDQPQEPFRDELLETKPPDYPPGVVVDFLQHMYGLEGELSPFASERDQNFRLDTPDGRQYAVKIANTAEGRGVLEMQARALEHIAAVDPELPVPRVLASRRGLTLERIEDRDVVQHSFRVLTYLEGENPVQDPTDWELLRPLGACLARLGLALRGFFHPAADHEILWDLKHILRLRHLLHYVKSAAHRELATHFIDRFENDVLPVLPKLRAQVVHNDFVPCNLLVDKDNPSQIAGIIDFGDMVHTSLVIDLATTAAGTIRGHQDPVAAAVEILAGYTELVSLERAELALLYDLIADRLLMLAAIATWRAAIHPENSEYITGSLDVFWKTLADWRALDPRQVTRSFTRTCGLWEEETVPIPAHRSETVEAHLERRARRRGPGYYQFYDRPLFIVRGEGVWLYDREGKRYLDVYNNVPHVGHCHPHVVNAIARQSRLLNTSTRYMHGLILELAERITSRMPEPLSMCMFVCTGSEANELAWRLARLVTGNSGALITGHSYHGNGGATIHFSSEEVPKEKRAPHVATLQAPLSNKAFARPDSGLGDALQTLSGKGHAPAMLLLDTAFTSDGIFTSPEGYLGTLFSGVRAAGGLCVADEVQAGYGRLGEHFWGFEFDQVLPDIVTMGKPMGNGHPLAAVVTRPEIVEVLARDTGYFNTFGGNPVSCAAGLAVLEVIEKENLQQNALEVGGYLEDRLKEMQRQDTSIGALHGCGLFRGIEVVKGDGSPDGERAVQIKNHLREHGVLLGTTGPHGHVLKIRPPVVFQREHADILLAALRLALEECQ